MRPPFGAARRVLHTGYFCARLRHLFVSLVEEKKEREEEVRAGGASSFHLNFLPWCTLELFEVSVEDE